MLVPQPRLLWLTGLLVCPTLALIPAYPTSGTLALAVIGGTALLVLVDALRAWALLDCLTAELPAVVRFVKGRKGVLPLRLCHTRGDALRLRLALGLAPHLDTTDPELTVELPATGTARLDWPVQARSRGRFILVLCNAETLSPLGFWARRRELPIHSEIRVQPDLKAMLQRNAAFLTQGSTGTRAQRRVGRGRDFEKLREYMPGDSLDEIHWRATAKRSHPVTKVFQIERTQEVYVLVDSSRLSGRILDTARRPRSPGANPAVAPDVPDSEPLLEQFIQSALVVGAVAERQGDLFGLVTFADQVDGFVRASSGQTHYAACRERLVELRLRTVTPDFEELAAFLRLRLRRRALLLFLTSLDDPVAAEGFVRGIDLLRQQHLCAVVQPRSPESVALYSHDRVATLEDAYRALAGHLQWQGLRELQAVLQHRAVTLVSAPGDGLATALITRYLDVKRRQLL